MQANERLLTCVRTSRALLIPACMHPRCVCSDGKERKKEKREDLSVDARAYVTTYSCVRFRGRDVTRDSAFSESLRPTISSQD
jgi:hypothetical protein